MGTRWSERLSDRIESGWSDFDLEEYGYSPEEIAAARSALPQAAPQTAPDQPVAQPAPQPEVPQQPMAQAPVYEQSGLMAPMEQPQTTPPDGTGGVSYIDQGLLNGTFAYAKNGGIISTQDGSYVAYPGEFTSEIPTLQIQTGTDEDGNALYKLAPDLVKYYLPKAENLDPTSSVNVYSGVTPQEMIDLQKEHPEINSANVVKAGEPTGETRITNGQEYAIPANSSGIWTGLLGNSLGGAVDKAGSQAAGVGQGVLSTLDENSGLIAGIAKSTLPALLTGGALGIATGLSSGAGGALVGGAVGAVDSAYKGAGLGGGLLNTAMGALSGYGAGKLGAELLDPSSYWGGQFVDEFTGPAAQNLPGGDYLDLGSNVIPDNMTPPVVTPAEAGLNSALNNYSMSYVPDLANPGQMVVPDFAVPQDNRLDDIMRAINPDGYDPFANALANANTTANYDAANQGVAGPYDNNQMLIDAADAGTKAMEGNVYIPTTNQPGYDPYTNAFKNATDSYNYDAANQGIAGPSTPESIASDAMDAALKAYDTNTYIPTTFDVAQGTAAYNAGETALQSGLMGGEGGPYEIGQMNQDINATANGGTPAGMNPYAPEVQTKQPDYSKLAKPLLNALAGIAGTGGYTPTGQAVAPTGGLIGSSAWAIPEYLKPKIALQKKKDKQKTWQDYAYDTQMNQRNYGILA